MIKIPFNDIVERIKKDANLSEEEINLRIKQKMDQLSGLISKEGAAHIIANELGVKVMDSISSKLTIKNILVGMRDVETLGKVTNVYQINTFNSNGREGKVASFMMADESASIRVVLWNNQADKLAMIKEGDIIKVKGAYVKENRNGYKELHLNDRSAIIINPEGEKVDTIRQGQPKASRKYIKELKDDENAEILGTIIQIYDIKFFETCPDCNKRLRIEGENFICQNHGNVMPKYSYVMNLIFDDGTDNIRIVCFRNQVERLIDKTDLEIQEIRKNPMLMEPVKTDLLGLQVKFIGRVTRNAMFDRLEFIANLVERNPNPEDELKALEAKETETEEVTSLDEL